MRLAQRQIWAVLADCARQVARTDQAPEGDAGNAADEKNRHCRTRTRCAIVIIRPAATPHQRLSVSGVFQSRDRKEALSVFETPLT